MKKSVRLKITAIFTGITVFLILAVFLINRYFLQGFYENQKVAELETAYGVLSSIVEKAGEKGVYFYDMFTDRPNFSGEEHSDIFREFSDKSNIDIVLLDPQTDVFIGASREDAWLAQKLRTYIEFNDIMEVQIPKSLYTVIRSNEDYTVQRTFDQRTRTMFLESWGRLSDRKTWFIMSIPLVSIAESARIMNRFLLIVGLIVLVIGSLIIYFTTEAVTKPLNQLAGISEKMSALDFSEKYKGNSEDEIGVLGNSMNTMSDRLSETISDLTEANRKLQEDIDLKEKIDTMRKDFISNVSHELKTPIALVEGYAEGLCEGLAEDPETRDYYCGVIMDEAGKMNRMVKSLTSLTNYEFGAYELTVEEFDITELIKNVLSKYSLSFAEKDARVDLLLPESCTCLADEFKIEEVFTNFITNALNHLAGERNIVIRLQRTDVKTVRLSVYNDGEPIPEESLPRIWEKFYKVDKARTREYGGSGIGLSIVKAIMEAHGKEYGVRNREHGVEFYITLDSVS